MEPTILKCKQCNWQGNSDEVDWEEVETCSGSDKTEVCPSCGSMEVYPDSMINLSVFSASSFALCR